MAASLKVPLHGQGRHGGGEWVGGQKRRGWSCIPGRNIWEAWDRDCCGGRTVRVPETLMRSLTETENPGEWAGVSPSAKWAGTDQAGRSTRSPAPLLCAAVGHFTDLLNLTPETCRSCCSLLTARVKAHCAPGASSPHQGVPPGALDSSSLSRTWEMGKRGARAPSSSSFPSPLFWPWHGSLQDACPKLGRPASLPRNWHTTLGHTWARPWGGGLPEIHNG